jgi:hypothetical protein
MGGAIISESGGGIIPLRGTAFSRNRGAASSGISACSRAFRRLGSVVALKASMK